MVKVRVPILERDGVDLVDFEEGSDSEQIQCGGLTSTESMQFQDADVPSNVSLQKLNEGAGFGIVGRYALPLIYNGTLSDGTFIGYLNTVNGLDTPIIIPRDSVLKDLTFSNRNSNADYTLYLRKNSPTATPFHTITKTNTASFTELDIDESFLAGEAIYIEYQDDGQNANDAVIVLFLRNN